MDAFHAASSHTLADLLDAYTTDYLPTLAPSTQRHYRYVYTVLCAPNVPSRCVAPGLEGILYYGVKFCKQMVPLSMSWNQGDGRRKSCLPVHRRAS